MKNSEEGRLIREKKKLNGKVKPVSKARAINQNIRTDTAKYFQDKNGEQRDF